MPEGTTVEENKHSPNSNNDNRININNTSNNNTTDEKKEENTTKRPKWKINPLREEMLNKYGFYKPMKKRCKAILANGKQCKRYCHPDYDFCYWHGQRFALAEMEKEIKSDLKQWIFRDMLLRCDQCIGADQCIYYKKGSLCKYEKRDILTTDDLQRLDNVIQRQIQALKRTELRLNRGYRNETFTNKLSEQVTAIENLAQRQREALFRMLSLTRIEATEIRKLTDRTQMIKKIFGFDDYFKKLEEKQMEKEKEEEMKKEKEIEIEIVKEIEEEEKKENKKEIKEEEEIEEEIEGEGQDGDRNI